MGRYLAGFSCAVDVAIGSSEAWPHAHGGTCLRVLRVCCLLQVFFWSSADLQGSASREKIEGCAGCIAQLFVWVRPCVFQAYRCRIRPRGGRRPFGPLQGEHRFTGGEHPFVCVSCAWGSCAYGSKIGQWPTEKALSEGECGE